VGEKNLFEKIIPIDIEKEVKKSFLEYSMSVIVSRAIPDFRDGLKPVHRRILYALYDQGMTHDKPHRKSATIVGEVMGKYHPHGDAAIYQTMVKMAQDFSMRYPLVDGHGNFGSIDGDAAAAMRYTESRMSKIASELLKDIDKDTIDWRSNYDDSRQEPAVLPARIPNLLINGSSGIAVGMATNIPPHNLGEVVDALNLLIDNPQVDLDELMQVLPGPDFPTAGIIVGSEGIYKAYKTGRGSIKIRAKYEIEERKGGKNAIVITEIPYQVNKARLVEKIAELARDKKIDGIVDLRDESNRKGIRVVVEVKKDANVNVVVNKLFKHTQLQDSFGIIMLGLVKGQPQTLGLKEILENYLEHRQEVIRRATEHDLKIARDLSGDVVRYVTRKNIMVFGQGDKKIVLLDLGTKRGVIHSLMERGCQVTAVPATTTSSEILALDSDGVLISDGPGDPQAVPYAIDTCRNLLGQVPLFGIGLGHQILALAMGAKVSRLGYGHRGSNHPVKDMKNGRVYITTQNHGFAIDPDSIGDLDLDVILRSLNDDSIEGIRHLEYPAFSVQFDPEGFLGYSETGFFYDDFVSML
jgi:anthranilate/para-aminobenzoate synthase component II